MHKSAMLRMSWFVDNYVKGKGKVRVLDVGSYDVNGCMRPLFDGTEAEYVGLNIESGPNVDVVMNEPYNWDNVPDDSFDFVISANAFEHIEYPWLTIKLIHSKLKDEGIACIIAPNSTPEHRYPFDCYRYFADGFRALSKWGGFQVINATVGGIPSPDVPEDWDGCNDTLMILIKSDTPVKPDDYPTLKYERRLKFVLYGDDEDFLIYRKDKAKTHVFKRLVKLAAPRIYSLMHKMKSFFKDKK